MSAYILTEVTFFRVVALVISLTCVTGLCMYPCNLEMMIFMNECCLPGGFGIYQQHTNVALGKKGEQSLKIMKNAERFIWV